MPVAFNRLPIACQSTLIPTFQSPAHRLSITARSPADPCQKAPIEQGRDTWSCIARIHPVFAHRSLRAFAVNSGLRPETRHAGSQRPGQAGRCAKRQVASPSQGAASGRPAAG
jgi:hypothetical protein